MSYSRFSECDVYTFLSSDGYLECCGCALQESEYVKDENSLLGFYFKPILPIIQYKFLTTKEFLVHLNMHKNAGHNIPEWLIKNLKKDERKNDNWIKGFNDKAAMENINSNLD